MDNLLTYKCPCCGGAIEYDSTSEKLKCPYCDTEFELDTLKAYDSELKNTAEDSFEDAETTNQKWSDEDANGMSVYICKSCGGEVVAEETTAATFCPFCGNPVVISGRLSGELYPDKVIPFKVDKKAAKAALLRHFTGKKLLPKIFKDENHLDGMKGVYLPYWFYDGDADASIRYNAQKVSHWSDKDYDYTRTDYYMAVRRGTLSFDHIPSDGSSKFDDKVSESIEPFYFDGALDFRTPYLSGFYAERYDLSASDCIERVKTRMKNSTEREFKKTVTGYTSVSTSSSVVSVTNSKASYLLCPVWILNTSWNGKEYNFYVNGQTGKIVGDLPLDKGAYWRWLLGLTAAISAGCAFLISMLWLMSNGGV